MSLVALIKLARLYDSQPVQQADWVPAEQTLFQSGSLQLTPATAKLLVNHDRAREVGSVLALVELPDTDGAWLAARCRVDAPPSWLRRGTKASFGYAVARSQQIGDWTRIHKGVLTEVSLLAPGVAPAESRAQVVLLREVPGDSMSLPAAGLSSDRPAVGDDALTPRVIRRYFPAEITVR